MPETTVEIRQELAAKLTDSLVEATSIPRYAFGVKFSEYEHTHAASEGRLCTDPERKPYLHMVLMIGVVSDEVRKRIIGTLTETFTMVVGKPDWKPVIYIMGLPYSSIGVEGQPLSERR